MSERTFTTTDAGLFLIRVMLAVVFVFHGSQKLFGLFDGPGFEGFANFLASQDVPLPKISAALAAGSEFFGGLALLANFKLRLVALPMAFTMFVAAFMVSGKGFDNDRDGMEYPLTLAVILVALALVGGGSIGVGMGRGRG